MPQPTNHSPYQDYVRNQELYGNLVGRRQRHGAIARATRQEQQRQEQLARTFQIDWGATDTWSIPATDNSGQIWAYKISEMPDRHLWDTLIWLVRHVQPLYTLYVPNTSTTVALALAARRWLASQPVFDALLREAVRRRFTFPDDVFRYLRDYAVADAADVRPTQPWKDPVAAYQLGQLDKVLHREIENELGKPLRNIEISPE